MEMAEGVKLDRKLAEQQNGDEGYLSPSEKIKVALNI